MVAFDSPLKAARPRHHLNSMRVVTYLPVLASIGGVEMTMLDTLRGLAARGHRISLFYERPGNLAAEFSSFCETTCQGASPLYSESPARDAARILRQAVAASRLRPDVIYVNNVSELAWGAAIHALTRAPVVCHLHEFKPIRRLSLNLLGGRVNSFVINSRFMRELWIRHGLDSSRAEVIHCGLEPAAYAPGSEDDRRFARRSLGLPEDAYIALYAGRLIPEKGIDVLLDAWRRLGLPSERGRLLIVGLPDTPDPYVEQLRARSPAGCEWLPMRRDVAEILRAADVLVLPSRWDEPFGRVIIEAMATGRPAVASAVGGIPEILSGEFETMLFPREDAAALASRLGALSAWRRDDPGLGSRCAEHATQNFGLERTVSSLERVFRRSRAVG